jgi:tetratricopeptide (TPR) repeat protein
VGSDPAAIGDSQFEAKQYDLAIAAYQRAESASANPSVRARAHSQIAECFGKKGDHEQARRIFLEVADSYPNEAGIAAKALLRAGDYALADQDLAGSVAPYDRIFHTYGKSDDKALREMAVQAAVHVARVRVRQANDAVIPCAGASSTPAAQEAKGKVEIARAAWEQVASSFPDKPLWVAEARLNLLELKQQDVVYGRRGDYAQVIAEADEYIAAFPDDGKHRATAQLIKAECQLFAGQPDAAIESLAVIDQAVASPAALGTAQRLLAQCFDQKGDYTRALEEYRKFLVGPMPSFIPNVDRPFAQFSIGACLKALGRSDEAVVAFEKVKQDYPTSTLGQAAQAAAAGLSAADSREER